MQGVVNDKTKMQCTIHFFKRFLQRTSSQQHSNLRELVTVDRLEGFESGGLVFAD